MANYSSLEICAGAGGQALGLEQAGFEHLELVELELMACHTLQLNRPEWKVLRRDVKNYSAAHLKGQVDLFAGGVPCPPFSIAGKQLGQDDERDLFPEVIRLAAECNPKAVMIENVKGILSPKFNEYRKFIIQQLNDLGYECDWRLLNASDYGVSQLRPRAILVGLKREYFHFFRWPEKVKGKTKTVGELLYSEMAKAGWEKAEQWKEKAKTIAPTLVGGSKKHGGADLGPTRAKQAWEGLGVCGKGLADAPPQPGFEGLPRLTLGMAALIQGFPKNWQFAGKKTPGYRQVGNAFPPPVAKAVGKSIIDAFIEAEKWQKEKKAPKQNLENTLLRM